MKAVFSLCLLASFACDAQSVLSLPTETDLKAAYCLGIFQTTLRAMPADTAENIQLNSALAGGRNLLQGNIQKITSYLLPRMMYLDVVGIGVAKAMGEKDVNNVSAIMAESCGPATDTESFTKCIQSNPRTAQLRSCYEMTFLPY